MRSIDAGKVGLAAALAATVAMTGIAQASVLVVRASGPSAGAYPAGKMLADTAKIMLKPNDALVLLDEHGTRTLKGPGNYTAIATAASEQQGATALAALGQNTDRRVRIGAVRGVEGAQTHSPNLWYLDAGRAGTSCILNPAKAMLWRPGGDQPATTAISGAGGATVTLAWSAGQSVQAWPAALPLAEGATYTLKTGTAAPTAVTVSVVGTAPGDPQAVAQTLIQHGCTAQVDLLMATLDATRSASGGN